MIQNRQFQRIRILVVISLLSFVVATRSSAETIKVGGTGAAIGVMRVLSAAFEKQHPDIEVVLVPGLGSGGGKKALMGGALDVAVTAKAGSAVEKSEGALAQPYGRSPFILTANGKVEVKSVTTQDIIDIYNGKKTTWPKGERVRLILRPLADSDSELLRGMATGMEQALKTAHARDGMRIAITDEDSADAIESTPGGLGTSMICLIVTEKRALNPLSINGITPSVKTLADGLYPWFKTFYLVSKSDSSPSSRLFIDFVLSKQGARILSSLGHGMADARAP